MIETGWVVVGICLSVVVVVTIHTIMEERAWWKKQRDNVRPNLHVDWIHLKK